MVMSARRRSNFVRFERPVKPTTGKYRDETWVTQVEAWVSLDPVRGREAKTGEEENSFVYYTVRGEYLELETISDEMRMLFSHSGVYDPTPNDLKIYNIEAVLPDEVEKADIMIKVVLNSVTSSGS